ncbi:MAG: hypothetical protein ACJ8C4_18980 [Gemmataceae bacterium]
MRKVMLALCLFGLFGVIGCGSDKDRGKNKDLDRPKPADSR